MWTTRHVAARTLLWLAAMTVPLQGLAATSCGCGGVGGNAESPQGCCSVDDANHKTCCCAQKRSATHSCCQPADNQQSSGCTCDVNCSCRNQSPRTPATPPVENETPTDKIASESLAANPVTIVCIHSDTRRLDAAPSHALALDALDRCVSLCRFTL